MNIALLLGEAMLGEAADPTNPAGNAVLAALDRADEFPTDAIARIDQAHLAAHYVPAEFGGLLVDYTDTLAIIRSLAERSITLAVAHGKTFLGAVCAWIGGVDEAAVRVADVVLDGRAVSWGLTERDFGSDLLGDRMQVVHDDDGMTLDGEKWLINNATRGGALTLLVRSRPDGGPRGFDLVFLDKVTTAAGGISPLPKELTHGIRGADISGVALDGVRVGRESLLCAPGHGLEVVMRALQLTRTLCCALSLGASDAALELALNFASERRLYGRTLIDLPDARRVVGDAIADHVLAEAFTTVVARSIQVLPRELSVHAAAAKFLVPTRTEATLRSLRMLVGARSVLDGSLDENAPTLGRIERDHRIVSLFDGNTVVNLTTLIGQFPLIAPQRDVDLDALTMCADPSAPLPAADLRSLSLLSRVGSSLLDALPRVADELTAAGDPAADRASRLAGVVAELRVELSAAPRSAHEVPHSSFVLAERLAVALAGAAALNFWHAADHDGELWREGLWVVAALDRALLTLGAGDGVDAATHDQLVETATTLRRNGVPLSILPGTSEVSV